MWNFNLYLIYKLQITNNFRMIHNLWIILTFVHHLNFSTKDQLWQLFINAQKKIIQPENGFYFEKMFSKRLQNGLPFKMSLSFVKSLTIHHNSSSVNIQYPSQKKFRWSLRCSLLKVKCIFNANRHVKSMEDFLINGVY